MRSAGASRCGTCRHCCQGGWGLHSGATGQNQTVMQVTEEDVLSFEADYCGSAEEQQDLLRYYTQFKGDMQQVGPAV